MATRHFRMMLEALWDRGNFVCVGLDTDIKKVPESLKETRDPLHAIQLFNAAIVDATKNFVCAYKPNAAFYEASGNVGSVALYKTIEHIRLMAPEVPIILDFKRGDIGSTNEGYVSAAFDFFQADAVTVHPYLGSEAMQPFLAREEKGVFVLCRTSNPGAGELQDLNVQMQNGTHVPLYQHVAHVVSKEDGGWNKQRNCGVVVGATYPDELAQVRKIVGQMPILIPGVGAQGGDLEKTIQAGKDSRGRGMIINSSRGIIFASKGPDFAEAAERETRKLDAAIRACLASSTQTV